MGQTDVELMRSWRRGDPSAFEALVSRWQEPVGRFLARLAGPAAAADLTQDTFLRLYQAGPRYREEGAFRTWLYRIALSAARDAGRRRRLSVVPLPAEELPAAPGPADADCGRRELAEAVAAALAELPPPQREAVVLRHYEELSFEDMARLLGVSASTLKSRFAAALLRLQERLREWGFAPEESAP